MNPNIWHPMWGSQQMNYDSSLYVAEGKSPLILAVTQEARESLASSSGMTTPRRYSAFLGIEPNSRDVKERRRSL